MKETTNINDSKNPPTGGGRGGELNKYSKTITQDVTQPAAQAMLYGIGLKDEDFKKPQIGICSMGYDGNTCNMHLNDLAKDVKNGSVITENDLIPLRPGDGISAIYWKGVIGRKLQEDKTAFTKLRWSDII